MRSPYSNDEVDRVAGQIYSSLSPLPMRPRHSLCCYSLRYTLRLVCVVLRYCITVDHLEDGAILLRPIIILRCYDIPRGVMAFPEASRLHIFFP
jgi:hypothetical protein